MSRITIQFKGGPFDGPNDVKDTGAPITVLVPHNGRNAVYCQAKDGEPAVFQGYESAPQEKKP